MRLLILLGVLVFTVDRAEACRCTDPGLGADMRWATTVFVATITDVVETRVCPKGPRWCYQAFVHTATVEGIWKGAPGNTVSLDTGSGRGDCSKGGTLGRGKRWLIFARGSGPTFRVDICSGNQPATAAVIERMTKRFGAPKSPT